ncbi:MAG: RnfABCDGE type electron transport complex subunit B [Betaproteobacteria bacterium]|nr:RnfABCDGE type electron transport complex subunit B [Betaproteobacteria bacterium]
MVSDADLIAKLDAVLPQTQCRQCGYAGCAPYARAMACGEAGANQCPPGGNDGARDLAGLLGHAYRPVDPRFGTIKPQAVALIDESRCIGCTLCIQACPVDAIVGAAKFMHTVIRNACTGCELCLPPCPVDCISLVPATPVTADERRAAARHARQRYDAREIRLARLRAVAEEKAALRAATAKKRGAVARAVERARERIAKKNAAR